MNMKAIIRNYILLLANLCLLTFSSCEKLAYPTETPEDVSGQEKTTLNIITRSGTNEAVSYPLSVYAFNSSGTCVSKSVVNSESESLSMSLAQGSYKLVAIGSSTGYDVPESISLTSYITCTSTSNYSTSPLQVGQVEVNLNSSTSSASVMMMNYSARMNIELSDVPSDVTAVTISISGQNSKVSLAGQGDSQTSKSTTYTLQKNGSKWKSDTFYTLASAGNSTIFSIALTSPSGTSSYGYTYSSGLKANTPYNLKGTYAAGQLSLTGSFSSQGWAVPIDLNFNFGPSANNDPTPSQQDPTGFPTPGTIFKGFFVASLTQETDTRATAMLMSLKDWSNMMASANENFSATELQNKIDGYSEGVVTQWCLPNNDDVAILSALFTAESATELNSKIVTAGGDAVDMSARYLCNDAAKTFSFSTGNISNGGTTKSDYHMRLVSWATIELE